MGQGQQGTLDEQLLYILRRDDMDCKTGSLPLNRLLGSLVGCHSRSDQLKSNTESSTGVIARLTNSQNKEHRRPETKGQ
eukprot:5082989-Amphidinium_carterae.1